MALTMAALPAADPRRARRLFVPLLQTRNHRVLIT